ncbi:MAG: succinylglutamate desuccinylase/aspartoacylase family protein [Zoogloeaceae bacterium]|jgi:hypothetical protein|nr:succinylglutamate desuccinylase/aspartoacylase family protein [Zoogloeaceae bacterium]
MFYSVLRFAIVLLVFQALLPHAAAQAARDRVVEKGDAGQLASERSAEVETEIWCAQLARRLRSVDAQSCRMWKPRPAKVRSAQGHPLMTIAPETRSAADQTPVRIFLIGGMHGDELASVSILFRWMPFLKEEEARAYVWRIAPLANPDGLFATPPRRVNGNGVDLNRNFPTPDWKRDALAYWQRHTRSDPRRYPGKAAQSEPETRWLLNEIATFRPDVIISVHAPYDLLDYDGPPKTLPRRFGRLNLNQLGVYPGSLGNFGGVFKNIPVITIELSHANVMPSAQEQRRIWDDMIHWIQRHILPVRNVRNDETRPR